MSIGENLHNRREELGMTLEDVAERLGVHRSTVLRYERGETQRLSIETIERLAKILSTTPAALAGWGGQADDGFDADVRQIARGMQRLPKERREKMRKLFDMMSDLADEEMRK